MTLIDREARARIRSDLGSTFVVEAAAGTGKTTALVSRIMNALVSGHTTLDRIVAVTFTDKAAGEMRLRLRTEIDVARRNASGEEAARLDRALGALEMARIGTLHAFCGDLVRERPIEAGVDPAFEQLDEDAAGNVVRESFDRWLDRVLPDPPEGIRRALRRKLREGESPRERLFGAVQALSQRRDFRAPWTRVGFDRVARVDGLVQRIAGLAAYLGGRPHRGDPLLRSLAHHERFWREVEHREKEAPRDYELLEAMLVRLAGEDDAWRGQGRGRDVAPGVSRKSVLDERDLVHVELDSFVADADADLAACLQRELFEVVDDYEARKARSGALDFLDLLTRTRDLLRRDAAVLAELRERFQCFYVDEFQDVDPVQAEVLLLLASSGEPAEPLKTLVPGKLFLVGDPKQSIYRFRRADVAYYQWLKDQLVAAGAEVLYLRTSFRARPEIQAVVNRAFAPHMGGQGGQAAYVPLEAFREASRDVPAIVALPVPKPYGAKEDITKTAVRESCPDAVAAFVAWLLNDSGIVVPEGDREVPIGSHHVCLLFRKIQTAWHDPARDHVRALEARGIPHLLVSGSSWGKREEVVALLAALTAIEWPSDTLAVYATLRGPFLSIADRELLAYTDAVGPLHPLVERPENLDPEVAAVGAALDLLGKLHRQRNRRPFESTIAELLEATRAHVAVAIRPTGEQALSNLLLVLGRARRFEATGATSFRAFVEWFEEECETSTRETPFVEEGTAGVRLSTIHAAKGLEFPVVVLCDPGATRKSQHPSRYVDAERGLCALSLMGCAPRELVEHRDSVIAHDDAEEIRLAYVAATRARDMLVLPVVGDDKLEGWIDVFHDAVYPGGDARRHASKEGLAAKFGDDSVLVRSPSSRRTREHSVMPGLHVVGGTPIAWWDPRALALDVEPKQSARRDVLVPSDGPGEAEGIAQHARWAARRSSAIERGATPTVRVQSVTEVSHAIDASSFAAVALETVPRLPGRPRGKRFGSLVHAILEHAPLGSANGEVATLAGLAPLARAHARILGASIAEVDAALSAALAAIAHPVMRRAALAEARGECHREMALAYVDPAGTVVEGIVDLAFKEGDRFVLVDFKTDAKPDEQLAYRVQLALYADALKAATGAVVDTLLLAV